MERGDKVTYHSHLQTLSISPKLCYGEPGRPLQPEAPSFGCFFILRKGSSKAVFLVQVWRLPSTHLNMRAVLSIM